MIKAPIIDTGIESKHANYIANIESIMYNTNKQIINSLINIYSTATTKHRICKPAQPSGR